MSTLLKNGSGGLPPISSRNKFFCLKHIREQEQNNYQQYLCMTIVFQVDKFSGLYLAQRQHRVSALPCSKSQAFRKSEINGS